MNKETYISLKSGIFLNSKKSNCSIYESGIMCYNIMKKSDYKLDYSEEQNISITHLSKYDFIIVNHHYIVNSWITDDILLRYNGISFCIVTEVMYMNRCPINKKVTPLCFDFYIILDPSIKDKKIFYGFPRPIELISNMCQYIDKGYPIIGSFGFATQGKEWREIVNIVQNEYDNALIRFNIPYATHCGESYKNNLEKVIIECKNTIYKPNIKLEITHIYMTQDELIAWCGQNTINCFFYTRTKKHNFQSGLCATTDQAITSGRPLLITHDPTFRHILQHIKHYPEINLKQAIIETPQIVAKLQNLWSCEKFLEKFNYLLNSGLNGTHTKNTYKKNLKKSY